MMLMKRSFLIVPVILALIFGFSACDNSTSRYTGQTGAELLELRVQSLGTESVEIPVPIAAIDWDFSGYNLTNADFVTLEFNRETDVTNVRLFPTASPRAWVEWGVGSRTARPEYFYPVGIPATFETNDYLYIKVSSEDGNNFNYYRFLIRVFSSVTHLGSVTISGRRAVVKPGGGSLEDTQEGSISISKLEAEPATIEYETFDPSATVKFAKVGAAGGDPVFEDSNIITFADQDILYIEVIAQNSVDIAYYKIRVSVGRIATIKTLTLTKTSPVFTKEVVGKGTPNAAWATTLPGSVEVAEVDATFAIGVVTEDPQATYLFEVVNPVNDKPNWAVEPTWTNTTNTRTIDFNPQGTALGIKVVSDNGLATLYYKVQVEVLAAEFTVQPQSDYYYYYDADTKVGAGTAYELNWYTYVGLTGDKAVSSSHPNFTDAAHGANGVYAKRALKFELDRVIPGATYQWYEANSWYGGYGFDADGRRAFKHPSVTDAKGVTEAGFVEYIDDRGATSDQDDDDRTPKTTPAGVLYSRPYRYYIEGLDEKGNVSLHNGGNNYYRLEVPGRPIPGETGSTYTPKVDYRPFLQSFTSESHYYWVVVTDPASNRTVTSKRAVIVSERDPTKDHYIVNLNAYLDSTGTTPGLQGNPKNLSPFTAGNHGDKYEIPIYFEGGNVSFNVKKYSTVTCQALFYLADGRPFIQNWTQGDFGFADEAKVELVLWYNLTADNATRGLQSSGNAPSGSGLSVPPYYLVVKPAGTKDLDLLPPFVKMADGITEKQDTYGRSIPENINDAQGWFTPYIEIVELRFEGPARPE